MFNELKTMMSLLGNKSKIADEVQKFQARLPGITAEGTAGAGYVAVKANGRLEIVTVSISPDALALNDGEMLGDLISAAANQALDKVRQILAEESAKMAAAMGLPPGMMGGGMPGLG